MNTEIETRTELTLQEVCVRLNLPWHRAYTWMLSGLFGTPRKVGRAWLIPADGVEAYLDRERTAPRTG